METKFLERIEVAPNIFSCTFEKPKSFTYIAGQFIELTLNIQKPDQRGNKRWFTLSSSPTEPLLAITTKRSDAPSTFKDALFSMKKNDIVTLSEPMGDFVLPRSTSKPLVFVAGGIGVTPYRSMCKFISDNQQQREIHILYAAETEHLFAYADELSHVGQLHKIIGALHSKSITDITDTLKNPAVYISGPEPLVEAMYDELKPKFTQNQLLRDYFPNYTYDIHKS